ncbi:MAG: hypothetical protein AB1726_13855 [Planctomycetota bacterium]
MPLLASLPLPALPRLSAALLLPVLAVLAAPADAPRFAPAPAATLTKAFTLTTDLTLDSLQILADGQDVGEMIGAIDLSFGGEQSVTVTDVYGDVAEGRPRELTRTFDAIEGVFSFAASAAGEGDSQEVSSQSALEGRTVVFRWDAEEGAYDVTFAEGEEGDQSLLEGLEEDMDLRALLPEGDVAANDAWKVDIAALGALVVPGGDLSLVPEESGDVDSAALEKVLDEHLEGLLEELFAGEGECTYKGTREEEGVKVAEIALRLEVSSSVDLTKILLAVVEMAAEEAGEEMPDFDISAADLSLDYEGEGVLLWDVERGLLSSFEITGLAEIAVDLAVTVEAEGEKHSVDASVELSGSIAQSVTTRS